MNRFIEECTKFIDRTIFVVSEHFLKKTVPKLTNILFCVSGGTKPEQYSSLPTPIVSRTGFQGCISSLETNGELIDPIRHALVPSNLVEEGCKGNSYMLGKPTTYLE